MELSTVYPNVYFEWAQMSESNDFHSKSEIKECTYKLDIGYMKKKPTSLKNFFAHLKQAQMFNKNKEFRLALVM